MQNITKKITFLLGSLDRGGTETLLLDVFRNAKKNNLHANCLYRKKGELENDFITAGLEIHKIPVKKNIFSYLIKLRQFLLKNNTEVVHAQQPIDAFFAYFASIGTSIKIVLSLHGYDFNESKISSFILNFIIKRTERNIYVSNTLKTYYTNKYKLGNENQKLVYNGISFEKFDNNKEISHNIRKEFNINPETTFVVSVGSFNVGRDQLTLCLFANELKARNIDFKLLLIGKRVEGCAYLYDRCVEYCRKNKLEENVIFTGIRPDVPNILKQADCFVYATEHDTFGIAVVEAIATGLPVFVNDWEVMKEITDDGKLATLYKSKHEKDLVQKFMLFLQDKNNFVSNAAISSKIIRDRYKIENHIGNLLTLYNSL